MKMRSISTALIAASTMAYGNAKEAPEYTTSSSFHEVGNNIVYYGFNRIHPKGNQMQVIDKHIDELRSNPDMLIRITSHTDHIGNWEVNLNISRKRAIAIAEYLRENGVPQDKIVLDWLGESDPMYFSDEEKYKNRRSHISVVKKVTVKIPKPRKTNVTPFVNIEPIENTVKPQVVVAPKKESVIQQPKVNLGRIAYQGISVLNQPSESNIQLEMKPLLVSTPLIPETEITPPEASKQKGDFEFQKNILFVDAVTMEPVAVDVDIKTNDGKKSFSATKDGHLNIDYSETETRKMDVYAHGYFYTSVKINPGPFQQIIKLKPTVKGEKLEINNLEFVSGKSVLMKDSKKELEKIYLSLMMNPDAKIEIGGHVNAPNKRKLDDKKFQISVNRAKSVYNYLVKKGIPKKNITYKGYGNSEMIHPKPKTEEEKAKNRRVEIKILK